MASFGGASVHACEPASRPGYLVLMLCLIAVRLSGAEGPFPVKYVADKTVYLSAGRNAGLSEGMKLTLRREGAVVADVQVVAVAATSSACDVQASQQEIRAGDLAFLSPEDAQTLESLRASRQVSQYAQVVTFTTGDPLDEEARESVPRPPLPEVNRARGRIGFEYSGIRDRGGAGLNSDDFGVVFRGDLTRIGGSYWNLSGYWRGRRNAHAAGPQQETLTDLLNRTYHLTLYYDNPRSPYRLGFGRFYLPWASSLDTIDGGYFARRFGKHTTTGIFAGSTPDPTSWNYNPDRQIFGTFVNYEQGSFDSVHYTGTAGIALTRILSRPERQFAFFENIISYKHSVSVYHTIEVDNYRPVFAASTGNETGVLPSRSFLTVRLQPAGFLALDFSHNYFRNTPTFDPRLVGTGLLDKLLFQGLSAGFRLDLPLALTVYSSLGKSDRNGDARSSWNQMYGVTARHIWRTSVRGDIRYSKFDSAFGRGSYRSVLFSREFNETLRFDLQAGDQDFVSPLTRETRTRWANASLDWFLATRYVLGGGYTVYRGRIQNYDQLSINLGYRF